MVKVIALLKRRSDLTHEQFLKYWRETHAPLALKLFPGLRKYVHNYCAPSPLGEPAFDGVAEIWVDDVETLNAFTSSEEGKKVNEDEQRFIDHSQMVVLFVEEKTVK
jgi:uncharacterized protein (TIGR02118 family)